MKLLLGLFATTLPHSHKSLYPSVCQRGFLTSIMSSVSSSNSLVVDPFCFRQFAECDKSKEYGGTVFSVSINEFEGIVNARYDETKLKEGYAPFCKHLFIENNFTDAQTCVLAITKENEHLLRTKYEARNDKEVRT
uniref:Uncharacterized protein n=1 Tax=Eucampia antarctica TaxID=49252 RepID=A0A7S2W4A1_9STRA|mmetsp:Transcript_19399/g.18645  ORF Transcript_19399/g.18645 Transcript_19399/m.18645 type:complete len:136 (+) Transcript_19399:26-433(+)